MILLNDYEIGWCIVVEITANLRCIIECWDVVGFENYNNHYKTQLFIFAFCLDKEPQCTHHS